MMQNLPEKEIIRLIRQQQPFAAVVSSRSFSIKIDRYVPAICTSIQPGPVSGQYLPSKAAVPEDTYQLSEEPYLGEMLDSFPIALKGLHCRCGNTPERSQGDLSPEKETGKKIKAQRISDGKKVRTYYKILHNLLEVLEEKYGGSIVYDLHSFKDDKELTDLPLFNISTHCIDSRSFHPVLKHLAGRLNLVALPNVETRVAIDEVQRDSGYQAEYIKKNHPKSLCIPIDVKKVYMDDETSEPYPLILESVKEALKQAVSYNGAYFARNFLQKRILRPRFIGDESNQIIQSIDIALYKTAKGIDTLHYINPINFAQERKTFFSKNESYIPKFRYRQLKIDPYAFRKNLYAIPVDRIQDVSIRQLYRSTVDMLARKIDLLTSVGTEHFLYNSLRFYGEPRKTDIELARFFISAPPIESEKKTKSLSLDECVLKFQKAIDTYGFDCSIELTNRIVARAMVDNTKQKVLLNTRAHFTETEIEALIHHELGVHMVTTINANQMPLKIFKIGLPGNTQTQEGLALLSEYFSGNLTLTRLKALAHRVRAVHLMVQHYDFPRTYKVLTEEYGLPPDEAFTLTARVYRGGGFTKDYLYLNGLRKALRLHRTGADIRPLFIGKTTIFFLDTIKEMIARKVLKKPVYLPRSLEIDDRTDPILKYLLKAIQ